MYGFNPLKDQNKDSLVCRDVGEEGGVRINPKRPASKIIILSPFYSRKEETLCV